MVGGVYGRVYVWQGVCERGECVMGVCAGETTTEAGNTHPTGMHTCLY